MSIFSVAGSTPSDGFELKSGRFDDGSTAFLSKAYQSSGNRRTWTYSCWAKRGEVDQQNDSLLSCDYGPRVSSIGFMGTGTGVLQMYDLTFSGGSYQTRVASTAVYRDPAAWYHIVVKYDTTQATASDRVKLYVNGEQITDLSQTTYPSQNYEGNMNYGNDSRLTGIGKQTGTGDYYDGLIAESYFLDGSAVGPEYFGETNTLTNQWQPKNPTDIKEAVTFGTNGFYLPFSSDALNNSFTNSDYHVVHTVTPIGTAHTDTTIKKFGTASCQLDGNSDYLSLPDSMDWILGTGDFTLEAWVYNTTASGTQRLFSHTAHNVNGEQGFNVYLDSGSTGRFTWSTNGNNEYSWNFANCMTQNTWTHFALTRTGTSLKVFKNGVLADSTTNANMTTIYGGGKPLFIGAMNQSNTSVTGYFEGYIDEVRFSNIVRYYGPSFSVATAAFTVDENTKLLLHMDGSDGGTTFTDSSWTGTGGTGLSISETGDMENVRIKRQNLEVKEDATGGCHFIGPKFGTGCLMVDESNDNLVVPSSSDWAWGTGDFTVETWANVDMIGNHNELINCGGQDWRFAIESNGKPSWNHSGSGAELTSTIGVIPHKWFHLAVSRSSGTSRMFLDGVLVDSAADTHSYVADTLTIGSYSTGSYGADGYMDEIRISNSARYTAAFTPDTTAFSNDANTKLLIHSDGSMGSTEFIDSSNTTRSAITIGGNTHTDTTQKKVGTASAQFDGTGDYLVLPKEWGNYFIGGSGDWTFEGWVYWDGSADAIFFEQGDSADRAVQFYIQADGDIQIYLSTSGSSWNFNQVSGSTLSANTWTHVALVKSGSGIYLFKDGVLDGTINGTTTHASINNSSYVFNIGAYVNSSGAYSSSWPGYMDEIRFSNVARYTSTFTNFGQGGGTIASPTAFNVDDNTTLLLHCDGSDGGTTFTDSVTGHPISVNGSARVIAPKFGAKGCYRNNGGDNGLAVPRYKEPWAEFDTGDFTVEAWVCLDDIGTNNQQFFTHRWGVNSGDWVFWWDSSSGLNWSGSSNTLNQGGTTGWASNTWVHIAACRTGQTNRLFVNGAIVATNISASQNYNATAKVYLASYGYSAGDQSSGALTGFMQEARIIQGKALYAGNFTPATTAYSSDANTKLLLHCDGSDGGTTFTDSSGSTHTMTAVGNTHTDTTIKKIGTASGQFDGTGDYISTPNSADFNFGTGDFTFEGWYYTTATTDQVLFSQYQDASNRWYLRLDNRTAQQGIGFYNHNGSIDIEAADKTWPGVNQWVHMALVRYNGVISIYINGESVKLKTNSGGNGSFANNTGTLRIGDYNGGNNYSGYMDEIRISNSARYTATFTPATQAFNDDRDTPFLMHMDGSILIDPETGFATGAGEGQYARNDAVNAIFYDATTPNLPLTTNESMIQFPGNGYLTLPSSTDFDFGTGDFTIECWMYLTKDQDNRSLYTQSTASNQNGAQIEFVSGDEHIATYDYDLESSWSEVTKSNKPIPLGKWIHFAYVRESLAFYLYIDGVRQSSTGFTSSNAVGAPTGPQWGFHRDNSGRYLDDVYLDQMRISNNARYSVNFTPPTAPFTADANTLSLIQSDWSEGSLGADHSGNYNTFTPTNLGSEDMMEDSPMNNFVTLNPLDVSWSYPTGQPIGPPTLSEGNLKSTKTSGSNGYEQSRGTIAVSSGKWYYEMYLVNAGSSNHQSFGIATTSTDSLRWWGGSKSTQWTYQNDGSTFNDGTQSSGDADTYAAGDVCSIAFDCDAGKIWFAKNNTWLGSGSPNPATGADARYTNLASIIASDGNPVAPFNVLYSSSASEMFNFGQDSSFGGNVTAQGNQDGNDKGDFYYTPPSGFLALCTDNLSNPSIALPGENFNTVLYTGNTPSSQAVTGVGFQPEFLWLKSRSATTGNIVQDVVRGATKRLETNSTGQEVTDATYVASFDSDGFTVGTNVDTNASGGTFVAWNWKAGGSAVSNTDGTITSSVSANPTAGFSILTWSGNSTTNSTIGHGLSQAPDMFISKALNNGTDYWAVYVKPAGQGYLALNANGPYAGGDDRWGSNAPTASVMNLGYAGSTNTTSRNYVGYCFHSVEGYSKVGSYEGNGSGDGPFIYTGFAPAMIIIKNIDNTQDWSIWDNRRPGYNVINEYLKPNDTSTTSTATSLDMVSNGFRCRGTSDINNNNVTMIYIAFAEDPFKTANAR